MSPRHFEGSARQRLTSPHPLRTTGFRAFPWRNPDAAPPSRDGSALGRRLGRTGQPRTTRRVAIHRHRPRPIVAIHGRRSPRRRELPPARPNHLGGCGTTHRRWCGGSDGAASRERPDPDADCDRFRFAHAGLPKPHPGNPKPHEGGISPTPTPPAAPTERQRSLTPTGAPPAAPSEPPTPSDSLRAHPNREPPPQRPPTPPASSTGAVPLSSVLIALAVLVLVSLVLLRLARKGKGQVAQPEAAPPRTGTEAATDVLLLLASAGEALIDSGFDVDDVDANLEEIARAYGMAETEIVALPTALLVSSRTGGQVRTRAVTSGRQRLRLHQIEELDDVVRVARTGRSIPRGPTIGSWRSEAGRRPSLRGCRWSVKCSPPSVSSSCSELLARDPRGRRTRRPDGGPPARRKPCAAPVPGAGDGRRIVQRVARGLPAVTDRPGVRRRSQPDRPAGHTVARGSADHLGDRVVDRPDGLRRRAIAAGAVQLVLLGLGILAAAALVGVPAFDLTATSRRSVPLAPGSLSACSASAS